MARVVEGVTQSDHIFLKVWDPDGDTYVVFQRPRRREAELLSEMQAQSVLEWDTDTQGRVRQSERVPLSILESTMVSMCLIDSNLAREVGGEEVQVFIPGKSCRAGGKGFPDRVQNAFSKEWRELPDELCEEIVDLLREWHPPFNWRGDEED